MIDIDELLRLFAAGIDETLKTNFGTDENGRNKVGFALLVFGFGEDAEDGHYISNADRGDMIKALRETADIIERNQDMGPAIGGVQ